MKRAVSAALLLVLACAALPATAGGVDVMTEGGPQPNLVRSIAIPVKIEGSVQVDFAGDASAGCRAPCGVAGSLTWDPPAEADLSVDEYRSHGERRLEGSLFFFGGLGANGPITTAHVTRETAAGSARMCSDARAGDFTYLNLFAGSGPRLEARLLRGEPDDADLFRSRCGGPLERDLVAALPAATIDRTTLLRGGSTLDLSGKRPFTAHRLAGTINSSLELSLGRALVQPPPPKPAVPRTASRRAVRTVTAVYRIERFSGNAVTSFRGGPDQALCEPLDACGTAGSVRLSPLVTSGRATLAASGNARRASGRELRAALGLRPGRHAPGIVASGSAGWTTDAGSALESFAAGDGTACSDSVALSGGYISLWVGPRRVFASYGREPGPGPDPFRTRCPGPSMLDVVHDHPLATGNVPRREFRKRRVVIPLTRGRTFESEPYAGETRVDLEVVLRRVKVRERLELDALSVF